jgi:hypothetical protein
MAVSLSDFLSKVQAAAPASGATFTTSINADGTIKILRAASAATSLITTVLYPRVLYDRTSDLVTIDAGGSVSTETSAAFIAGLT